MLMTHELQMHAMGSIFIVETDIVLDTIMIMNKNQNKYAKIYIIWHPYPLNPAATIGIHEFTHVNMFNF